MEHQVTIGFPDSESREKAVEVAQALISIRNVLGDADTIELAKLLKAKPGLIKTAKQFLR